LGLEVVRILEAASNSLRDHGAAVETILPDRLIKIPATNGNGHGDAKEHANGNGNGNGHSNGNGHGVVVPAGGRAMVSA
jgi:hypothetical protein